MTPTDRAAELSVLAHERSLRANPGLDAMEDEQGEAHRQDQQHQDEYQLPHRPNGGRLCFEITHEITLPDATREFGAGRQGRLRADCPPHVSSLMVAPPGVDGDGGA